MKTEIGRTTRSSTRLSTHRLITFSFAQLIFLGRVGDAWAADYITQYTHISGEVTCGSCGGSLACLSQCDNCMAKVRYDCDGKTRIAGETPVPVCCMGCSDMKCQPDLLCNESQQYLDGVAIAYESTCPPEGTGRGRNDHDCRSRSKGSINYLNGNVHHGPEVDLALAPRGGVGLSVRRHFNSDAANEWLPFGYGWTSNLDEQILDSDTTTHATFLREDGRLLRFERDASGAYHPPRGYDLSLLRHESRFELRSPDGTRRFFDTVGNGFYPGRLIRIENANGQGIDFEYSDQGQLIALRDPFGAELRFVYDSQGSLSQIRGPYASPNGPLEDAPVRVSYLYGSSWELEQVDLHGAISGQVLETQRYRYDGSLRLVEAFACSSVSLSWPDFCADDARRSWVTYRYDTNGRGVEKRDAHEGIDVSYASSPRRVVVKDKASGETSTLTPHPTRASKR